jgi:inner membrane protein COX18
MSLFLRLSRPIASRTHYIVQSRHFSHVQGTSPTLFQPPQINGDNKFIQQRRNLSFESYVSFIKDVTASIGDSRFTAFFSHQLCNFHDITGLPWWTVIIVSSVVMRFVIMFPAQVTSQRVISRRKKAFEEMHFQTIPALKKAISLKSKQQGWSFEQSKKQFMATSQELKKKTIIKYNCALPKVHLPNYIQIPVWLSMTFAIRMLANSSADLERKLEMVSEGPLYMTDLTVPVGSIALPLFIGAMFWMTIEISVNRYPKDISAKPNRLAKFVTYFSRSIIVLMVVMSCNVESAVALYWAGSAATGLGTNLLLIHPKVRQGLGIMKFEQDPDQPYRVLYENMSSSVKSLLRIKSRDK